jgi:hypothetical protein
MNRGNTCVETHRTIKFLENLSQMSIGGIGGVFFIARLRGFHPVIRNDSCYITVFRVFTLELVN